MKICKLKDLPLATPVFVSGISFPDGSFNVCLYTSKERRDADIEFYKNRIRKGGKDAVPGLTVENMDECIHTKDSLPPDAAMRLMSSWDFTVVCEDSDAYGTPVGPQEYKGDTL